MAADPKVVLYLHSSSDLYGSDRSLMRTVQNLDRSTFTPVVCVPYDGPLVAALRESGCAVEVIELAVLRRGLFNPIGLAGFAVDVARAVVGLRRVIVRYRPAIIHSNTAGVIVGGWIARMHGIPHVWHIREIIERPTLVRKFIAAVVDWGATRVLGVSKSVIDHLAVDQPGIREKSLVLYNGLDASLFEHGDREETRKTFGVAPNEILVGMIARVSHWKGQDLFLDVAQRVASVTSNVIFVAVGSPFVGQEDRMVNFRSSAERSGLGRRFQIEEFRSDVRNILAALDVFVLPSTLPDPFPTTVLEAMAASRAVVANAHGGVTEMLVDGESGFLVSPNDAAAMADRIIRLSNDQSLRTRFGAAARSRVTSTFTVQANSSAIDKLYRSLLRS